MNEQEFKDLVDRVGLEAANKIKASMAEFETKSEKQTKAFEEKLEASEKALRAMGERVNELETAKAQPVDMSLEGQIKSWMEANKENIKKIKAGESASLEPLHIKVAGTMMVSTTALPPVPIYSKLGAEINDFVRIQPTFWRLLPKGRTSLPTYFWINKTNKQGTAQFIGEGVLKPLASFDLVSETSNAKKVAERMKASTEILEDVEGMASLIEGELRFEVEAAANAAVLTGTASATSPAGITKLASAYTATSIKTANPTYEDCIRAAIAQIRMMGHTGQLAVFINPADGANMDMAKATTSGVYMLPPFMSADNTVIKGAPIIEDNGIPAGFFLVADLSKYRILIYKDFTVVWGWENDDFSKNLVTVIGEMRIHQFMSANNAGAFVYDSYANVKTALTAP